MSVENATGATAGGASASAIGIAKTLTWIGIIVGLTALMGTFTTLRYKNAGAWVPDLAGLQDKLPCYWRIENAPLAKATLAVLGNPQAVGRRFTSPFGEGVEGSVVTAGDFENYHDPTVCVPGNGFILTGKKIINMGGCNVRAMVFKRVDQKYGEIRMLMYYWQQTRDGATDTAARMGSFRDIEARFKTGFGAVVLGQQTVLCRVYGIIRPDDTLGAQTQRNVEEISLALYRTLKEDGARR